MKGKSYTAGTPEAAEAVFENCFFIDGKGRANSRTEYRVQNVITAPGKECFILYNPETGKTRHAKRIFIPSNVIEPGAILYSHPHRGLVRVDGIEEQTEPGEALIRVYYRGFLYLVSLSDLYSDSSERHPAKLDTTPAPDTTPADVLPEESPAKAAEATPAPEESPTIPAPPYKTPEEITAAFIADGWTNPNFREATPDERTRLGANSKLFIMTDTGNTYNDRGEIYCYNLPAAREPAQAASQDATSPAIISDKETTTASPENGSQAAREETPERLKESRRDNPGTTPPPGIYKTIPGPETVTESASSQPGTPAAAHDARPRRGPTRPARTASHTDTHGGHKTPYRPKYKARRTHAAPPGNTYFFKNPHFVGLVYENVTETICNTKGGPVFEQVLGQLYTEGPPPGYQKMMQYPGNEIFEIKKEG